MGFDCSNSNPNLVYRAAPFEQISGTSLPDLSAGGNTGTITGTLTNGGKISGRNTLGSALAFAGSQTISVADNANLRFTSAQSFCFNVWVNVTAPIGAWCGVMPKSRDASPWYGLWLNNDNKYVFGGAAGDLTGPTITSGWHMVTSVQNASTTRLIYVDAILFGTSGSAQNANGTGTLLMGQDVGSGAAGYLTGAILIPSIYNIAPTASDVTDLFNYTGAASGLLMRRRRQQAMMNLRNQSPEFVAEQMKRRAA